MPARTRKAPVATFQSAETPAERAMRVTNGGTTPAAGMVVDPFALTVVPTASLANGGRATKAKPLPQSLAALIAELLKRDDHVVVLSAAGVTEDQFKSMKSILRSNRDKYPGFNIRITNGHALTTGGTAIKVSLHAVTNG